MTVVGAAIGGAAAIGLWLLLRGMRPPRRSLEERLEELTGGGTDRYRRWWLEDVEQRLASGAVAARRADLLVTDTAPWRWRRRRVAWLLGVGLAAPLGLVVAGGAVRTPPTGSMLAVAVPLGVAGGWWGADRELRREADRGRREIRHAVGLLLELAAVALAGGAGPAEALRLAADAGDGHPFRLLRAALAGAEARRRSPYEGLEELGVTLAVAELRDAGQAMALADEKGAPVKAALTNKASSVAFRLVTTEEADATARSTAMSLPSVLMLVGFLLFLMFPFVAALLATTG